MLPCSGLCSRFPPRLLGHARHFASLVHPSRQAGATGGANDIFRLRSLRFGARDMRFGTLVGRRAPRSAQLDMGPRPLVRSAGSRTVVRAAGLVVQTRGYKFKLKTHKGTAKRFKPLAKGAFKRWQPGAHHLKRKLRLTRRREKRRAVLVTNATQRRKLRRLMPYA